VTSAGTLMISRAEVARLVTLADCITAVEDAFRRHAAGATLPPAVLSVPARDGVFHVKAAGLAGTPGWFAAKVNANYPSNPTRHQRPTIQGLVVLCETGTGHPLAVLDSTEITALRTAAATAVAARHLCRPDAEVLAVIGCGRQGRMHARALREVWPALRRVLAVDADATRAAALAATVADQGLAVEIVADPRTAARRAHAVVTCTPSRRPLLHAGDLAAGAFLAAVGADSPDKQEVDAALLARSRVVVDVREQCAVMGDLHHALRAGAMTVDDVQAELADVVAGRRPGRASPDDVVVFDSTGTALEDVAAAVLAYERAVAAGAGVRLDLVG
jgi:ornithine cyclodeaminase/alanine dehydrogenase-like protein (mu-crystallin family)